MPSDTRQTISPIIEGKKEETSAYSREPFNADEETFAIIKGKNMNLLSGSNTSYTNIEHLLKNMLYLGDAQCIFNVLKITS